MCGHIGLLVNFVFSLTRIFHGNAGGMSSGHTWHWGTPERSHQIPLGKPGLVIPRCETLASRSVTFPLHQRRVQRSTPSPLPCHEDLQLRVQRGERGKKKESKAKEKAHSCPTSTAAAAAAKLKRKKKKDQRLSIPLLREHTRQFERSWSSPTHPYSQVRSLVLYHYHLLAPYKVIRDCETLSF